jgi:hypothetical protein
MTRFRSKVRQWQRDIARDGPDQALFAGLLDVLGVGPNRALFQRLGELLKWDVIAGTPSPLAPLPDGEGNVAEAAALPGLLVGAGGFFLGERPAAIAEAHWRKLHAAWRNAGSPVVVAYEEWQRWGNRPRAAPWVRLLGAGCLLARMGPEPAGLRKGLPELTPHALRKALSVSAAEASLPWAPIGVSRADALAVNVVLPFEAASGHAAAAEEAFARYPSLEEDTVVRGLRVRLGITGRLSACQQQGLHYLHRWYCERGRQEKCPLRQGEVRVDVQV